MQVMPSPAVGYGKARNIMTAVFLGLFLLLLPFFLLSTGYEEGLSVMWRLLSDARQSGILEINGDGTALITLMYSFIGIIWSSVSLWFSFKEPSVKKATRVWAGILLGANILVIVSVFVVCSPPLCVDTSYNGNSTCALLLRP